jgi:EAL domain-containing protein (putative c-di-GMP-specific phosphodiesterase class I)
MSLVDPLVPVGVCSEAVILVVDDVEANVVLLQRLLGQVGVGRVEGFTDPRQAIERFTSVGPDLVLLDLHMPHLDGIAVLEALKSMIPADAFVPIVVLTADGTDDAKQRALAAGAKDFLTKPFDRTEVLLRVRNLLETRALHLSLQMHNAALRAELEARAEHEHAVAAEDQRRRERMRHVLDHADISMVFQPIVDLSRSQVVGVEALSRFPAAPHRPPDQWFAEAHALGLGADLEILAVRAAISRIDVLSPDAYLAVNVSPATAVHPILSDALAAAAGRIVLELTEHAPVEEYDRLVEALDRLRSRGVRVAVDDTGSGYACLRHILRVRPQIIKLDIDLTQRIDSDPARRALATSLVAFGAGIGATITAEGIETAGELETLRQLGVQAGQGYHLARPGPLSTTA